MNRFVIASLRNNATYYTAFWATFEIQRQLSGGTKKLHFQECWKHLKTDGIPNF